jgi:hypothetical protein
MVPETLLEEGNHQEVGYMPNVTFQVLMVASMKMRASLDRVPCSLTGVHWRFRGAYCLHHQDDEWKNHHPDDGGIGLLLRLHGTIVQQAVILIYARNLSVQTFMWR